MNHDKNKSQSKTSYVCDLSTPFVADLLKKRIKGGMGNYGSCYVMMNECKKNR